MGFGCVCAFAFCRTSYKVWCVCGESSVLFSIITLDSSMSYVYLAVSAPEVGHPAASRYTGGLFHCLPFTNKTTMNQSKSLWTYVFIYLVKY